MSTPTLYVADGQLISHLEVITTTVSVNKVEYPSGQSHRRAHLPGIPRRRMEQSAHRPSRRTTDASGADIGLLTCAPRLIGFYSRAGWTHAQGTPIIAGPDGATWTSKDVLLTRPTGRSSARFLRDIRDHPPR